MKTTKKLNDQEKKDSEQNNLIWTDDQEDRQMQRMSLSIGMLLDKINEKHDLNWLSKKRDYLKWEEVHSWTSQIWLWWLFNFKLLLNLSFLVNTKGLLKVICMGKVENKIMLLNLKIKAVLFTLIGLKHVPISTQITIMRERPWCAIVDMWHRIAIIAMCNRIAIID